MKSLQTITSLAHKSIRKPFKNTMKMSKIHNCSCSCNKFHDVAEQGVRNTLETIDILLYPTLTNA